MIYSQSHTYIVFPSAATRGANQSNRQEMPPRVYLILFVLNVFFIFFLLFFNQPAFADSKYTKQERQPITIDSQIYRPLPATSGFKQTGIASWYSPDFNGHTTSNGEIYDMHEETAAHKILPMNTILLVSNLENGKSTIVRINDRGPFIEGRILDLSYSAAKKLSLVENGTAKVQVTAIGKVDDTAEQKALSKQEFDVNSSEFHTQDGIFQQKESSLRLQKNLPDVYHTTIIQQFFSQYSSLYRVCVSVGRELQNAYKKERVFQHQYGRLSTLALTQ